MTLKRTLEIPRIYEMDLQMRAALLRDFLFPFWRITLLANFKFLSEINLQNLQHKFWRHTYKFGGFFPVANISLIRYCNSSHYLRDLLPFLQLGILGIWRTAAKLNPSQKFQRSPRCFTTKLFLN